MKKGLIQVYTGESDQMNFAPLGLGLRAAGHGLRTMFINFTPYEFMEGNRLAASLLKPDLVFEGLYPEGKSFGGDVLGHTPRSVAEAFQRSKEIVLSGDFDIVVLDGIFQVVNQGFLSTDEILPLLEEKPESVELVLTGPRASPKVVERADLVTEMVVSGGTNDTGRGKNGGGEEGSIEVVTGKGKGKTTYCLGKGMLMSSLGHLSVILQFIKSPKAYGEIRATEKLLSMEIKTMGEGFLNARSVAPRKKHVEAARGAWEECLREIFSLKYGLVVLDEINIATQYELIHPERVREMLFLKPRGLHLILSGQNAHPDVTGAATSVIEMRAIKHPFQRGIRARKGIEF